MNKLYGILVFGLDDGLLQGYYDKRHVTPMISDKGLELRDAFISKIPTERLALFACCVCYLAASGSLSQEILKLDPINTYTALGRDPANPNGEDDPAQCMWDMTDSAAKAYSYKKWLDDDLVEQLVVPTWPELVSVICVQLLREIVVA